MLETINSAMRVYSSSGEPKTGIIALSSFYNYPPEIDRTTGVPGPFIGDPSCYFDRDTQRWFHLVVTIDVDPTTGNALGSDHLDLAVSRTSSPLGAWTIYRVPVQDDGTQGTPNHGCSFGPCFGDYPHLGADRNGFYVTTNEYSFFGPEFKAAQIYAFSKAALARSDRRVSVTQFDTTGAVRGGKAGFTVWPATSPDSQYADGAGGTEFFLSSNAAAEVNPTLASQDLVVWALTNTSSLKGEEDDLALTNRVLRVKQYAVPPKSDQKVGDFPLGQCINDTTHQTPFGPGCWQYLGGTEPGHNEVQSQPDSNDTRMQQVVYANGKLSGALDTAVSVAGENKAGIEWFIVEATTSDEGLAARVDSQGYLAVAHNNVTYPAIARTREGRGVMAFTLVGRDHYPSAAFASIDDSGHVGAVQVAAEGRGPDDGFTGYVAEVGSPVITRWGDYGAAVADGSTLWIASEYIGQTCNLDQFLTDTTASPLFSCGKTRTIFANWYTRISQVAPSKSGD